MLTRFRQWWETAAPYLIIAAYAVELALFLLVLLCALRVLVPVPAKIVAFPGKGVVI
ncbi:hypothetical protein G7K71_13785 [Desulfofundulus sp. TPOSR]|uniref:hypothetical protein n=1 Tax=Desulfofundulus sp. TPOSR TaxID=2714340 RepID=UPI0014094354|nr:hypothetical protein [Desulfofundulus sp. TPOSR]NHM28028.1 hypothetical protein [Desulfofundulus sp. TPOSR]